DDGRVLTFNDARRFGRVAVIERAGLAAETGAGIDPLDRGFTAAALFALTRGRRTSIKALLMDQRRVAGLGNIYVNELLFRAGTPPGAGDCPGAGPRARCRSPPPPPDRSRRRARARRATPGRRCRAVASRRRAGS